MPIVSTRGFTLIEMLIVVVIIGILATIVINFAGDANLKSQDAAIKAELTRIKALAEIYYAENNQSYGPAFFHNGDDSSFAGGIEDVITDGMLPCPDSEETSGTMFHSDGGDTAKKINNSLQTALGKSSADRAGCSVMYSSSGASSYAIAVVAQDARKDYDRRWFCVDSSNGGVKLVLETVIGGGSAPNYDQHNFKLITNVSEGIISCG